MTLGSEAPVVAGSPVALQLSYRCGERPLQAGDKLALAWRLPCDWGELQFESPTSPNYVTAGAPRGVRLLLEYQDRGGIKPWHHLFLATVVEGSLDEGEVINFVLGDGSGGSVGWECQSAAVDSHRFLAMFRGRSERHWSQLPGIEPIDVVSGVARTLAVVAPSDCQLGEPIPLTVRMMDRCGNPSRGYAGDISVEGPGVTLLSLERLRGKADAYDVWKAVVKFERQGRHGVTVAATDLGLTTETNPIDCRNGEGGDKLFWGDLHSGQSDIGCGRGSLEEFYLYARHVAGLQFTSHQANDVYVTSEDWESIRETTEDVETDGEFLAFLGCEWTALPSCGGDRNVFYIDDQPVLHRAGRWYEEKEPDAWQDARDPRQLYERLRDTDAIINLHAGGYTSELEWTDDRLERLVEVHSTHGSSTWLVEAALEQGRLVGVSAGTDGISGRPGACIPNMRRSRNLPNGCFAVYAPKLSRGDIWRSIKARHCYGTDGERIRLSVRAGNHFMGDELTTPTPPSLEIEVAGTAAIEKIIVRRGASIVSVEEVWTEDSEHSARYRLDWIGTRAHGSSHAQMLEWIGSLRSEEGPVQLVGPIGFYGETDKVVQQDTRSITWRSRTSGNRAGFLFDAPVESDSRLYFESNLLNVDFQLPLRTSVQYPIDSRIGSGVVSLGRAPDPDGRRDCKLEVNLEGKGAEGRQAYWVEVIQTNGSRAWSSPIFITVT